MNHRPIAFLTGLLLCGLAFAMGPPALADLIDGNRNWLVFVSGAALTLFVVPSVFVIWKRWTLGRLNRRVTAPLPLTYPIPGE